MRDLETAPIPAGWLAPEARDATGSLHVGSEIATHAVWVDTIMFYAHRAAGLRISLDDVWEDIHYINVEPLPERRIAPARISPRGINIGAWIVRPENAQLDYYRLTGFEEARGQIFEIWHDDLGSYYM